MCWQLKLADQELDDWSNFRYVNEWIAPNQYRYSLAFSVYFFGAEQYHKFPAWQGTLQPAMDRLIQKMQQKPVWKYWEEQSKGCRKWEPNMDQPYPSQKDPIVHWNVMYSGHLGQMINLYEMLYRDFKWDKPGSIVLKWDDSESFVYDNETLQKTMFVQQITQPVPAICCEPNAIFPQCNTHYLLSLMSYDKTHGTGYFAAARPLYDKFYDDQKFIDPKTHDMAAIYLLKQGWVLLQEHPVFGNKLDIIIENLKKQGIDVGPSFTSSQAAGWNGAFMHAWRPQLVEDFYPYAKKKWITFKKDGSAIMPLPGDTSSQDNYYSFFSLFAAEVGDTKVRDGLLKTVDKRYSGTWEDGTYHYPFNDNLKFPTIDEEKGQLVVDVSDKSVALQTIIEESASPKSVQLYIKEHGGAGKMEDVVANSDVSDRAFALARALPKNGLWQIYNRPFKDSHYSEPKVSIDDVTKVGLKRAIYDRKKKALIISTFASKGKPGKVKLKINQLDPSVNYRLEVDRKETTKINRSKSYVVKVNTAAPHDIILYRE